MVRNSSLNRLYQARVWVKADVLRSSLSERKVVKLFLRINLTKGLALTKGKFTL
jgi:hypothetical protein